MSNWLDALKFNDDGLIPAIAQDRQTGQILMMAWQNREALELTAQTGTGVYFSRSRGKLWHKGESSGHTQIVHEIRTDCDADTITLIITQIGNIACHTGRTSCFYQRLNMASLTWEVVEGVIKNPDEIYGKTHHNHDGLIQSHNATNAPTNVLGQLDKILNERKTADKDSSYVASLHHKGLNKILEKVGEETIEAIIAAKELQLAKSLNKNDNKQKADMVYEVADVWFHSLVALSHLGLSSQDVLDELGRRFGLSGIDEKNARTIKS